MSSMSEQEHLNPRDPLYYAPRSLRERSALRGTGPAVPFAPASFDSQLESAVSDALRHPCSFAIAERFCSESSAAFNLRLDLSAHPLQ